MDIVLNMLKGDTLSFGVKLEGVTTLDTAFFSCKTSYSDNNYVFQKSIGDGIWKDSDGLYGIRVAPEDTENLIAGEYYCDLQIGVNGDVYTVLNGVLNIENDVTREV